MLENQNVSGYVLNKPNETDERERGRKSLVYTMIKDEFKRLLERHEADWAANEISSSDRLRIYSMGSLRGGSLFRELNSIKYHYHKPGFKMALGDLRRFINENFGDAYTIDIKFRKQLTGASIADSMMLFIHEKESIE